MPFMKRNFSIFLFVKDPLIRQVIFLKFAAFVSQESKKSTETFYRGRFPCQAACQKILYRV